MLILGIETSCDETSAALLEINKTNVKVLANVVSSQIKKHAPFGGVVPSLAAREHVKNLNKVIDFVFDQTLVEEAGYTKENIDAIAVTSGPGLISSLLVGTAFAKGLAWKLKKPLIRINHMEGHIASNWLKPIGEISSISSVKVFPALCLIVSGGHTQLVLMRDFGKYKLIGETLDDAAGEAFDKIARIIGLGYPGGPAISKAAENSDHSNTDPRFILPRPMLQRKDFNFSFSGLKTHVLYLVRELLKEKKQNKLNEKTVNEIAYAAQEAIVDTLVTKTMRAAEKHKIKSIMLSGGVSANKRLREELKARAEKLKSKPQVLIPPMEYTTDNAAMITMAGVMKIKNLKIKLENYQPKDLNQVKADANWELV